MTRKHEPEQQRDDRPEVAASRADMSWNRTGQWTFFAPVYRDQPAPCAVDCPLGIPVAHYLHLVAKGRLREAWQVLSEFNPLPAATGRVCYHACELNCNRAAQDQAVNIHQLERYLGDLAVEEGWSLPAPAIELGGLPVIVIGSGPAGMGSAYVLRSQGYPVAVCERETSPGGMLRMGVPEFRMPRRPLDGEIARLERLGVEFRCGQAVDDLDRSRPGRGGCCWPPGPTAPAIRGSSTGAQRGAFRAGVSQRVQQWTKAADRSQPGGGRRRQHRDRCRPGRGAAGGRGPPLLPPQPRADAGPSRGNRQAEGEGVIFTS